MDEQAISMGLGIPFLLQKLFKTHFITPHLSGAQGGVSDSLMGFCHDFEQS